MWAERKTQPMNFLAPPARQSQSRRDKPDILEVIGARTNLRKVGREYRGLAPCHDDRRPSLRVNPEKQLWFCDPCGKGGDVIKFMMVADGLTFPQALRVLDIEGDRPPPRRNPHQRAAALLAGWLNHQHIAVGSLCREVFSQIAIADEICDRELSIHLRREWDILSDLHGDLANPAFAAELWAVRESIEALTADVEREPPPVFPPLTESYRFYLRGLVQC
jgi:hypothetical protein